MGEEKTEITFTDKRRIKSADDTCGDAAAPDLERTPTFVEKLQSQVAENDQRLREYIAAHKERVAEMDRVRRRLEDEAGARAEGKFAGLVAELLPALDGLDRALEAAAGTSGPLVEGVRLVRGSLFEAMRKRGLETVDCVGKPFDPEVAQAVGAAPVDDEARDNIVLEQLAPGYRLGGRALRHALVRVGRKA
ncbi:MAG: nucleotide exchange factor GrpE [Nitrospinae bacterium]|nr:nucleotide exchange factor GrpE [Nitrospinota bacterium]